MEKELANEGVIVVGPKSKEAAVPLNLTLQWLESNPSNWPVSEALLLRRISEFCRVEVQVSPAAVVDALQEMGLIEMGPSPSASSSASSTVVKEKQTVQLRPEMLEKAKLRLANGQSPFSTSTSAVLGRVLPLLDAFRGTKKEPRNRAELEDLISPNTLVVFRANPRAVLEEMIAQDYLEISATSDEVIYDGPKIINWRAPPVNKGFGFGSLLLVIVILIMLVPGLSKVLGIY